MTRFVVFCAALLFAAVGSTQAVARTASHDRELWNTARIDALPPELRSRVMRLERACGAPVSAAKLFVLHLRASGTQFIALHFDDFRCENRGVLCSGRECLHEVYVRSGTSFWLALSIHAVDLKMTNEGDVAGLEVNTGGTASVDSILQMGGAPLHEDRLARCESALSASSAPYFRNTPNDDLRRASLLRAIGRSQFP
jgi:hypothetical protein